jgi:L-fucose mutarotase
MLKGISPFLSPSLIKSLCEMGHGDQIVLADAHFPGHSTNSNVIRADGLFIGDLLNAILPLFELDTFVDHPAVMMAAVPGDQADPAVKARYENIIQQHAPGTPPAEEVERFEFYHLAEKAFCVVMTGDTAKYGNLILTKGVIKS